MKRFLTRMMMVCVCLLGVGASAQASGITQCSFLVRALKAKTAKKAGTMSVTFHVLATQKSNLAQSSCAYFRHLIGSRQSMTLRMRRGANGQPLRKPVKRGDLGRVNYTVIYSGPVPGRRIPPSRSWSGWAPVKLSAKALKALTQAGVPFKAVKKRLGAAEALTAKGKALTIATQRKIKLSDVYTTCTDRAKGTPPAYCMFVVSIPHKDGRFLAVAMFSKELRHGITLKKLQKHFSYMSLEMPIKSLRFQGWMDRYNKINVVLRRPKLGKEIRLLRFKDGVVHGEATALTYKPVQLHSKARPCAPFGALQKLKAPCIVKGTRRIRVKLRFAFPLGAALQRCKKNPKAPRCR